MLNEGRIEDALKAVDDMSKSLDELTNTLDKDMQVCMTRPIPRSKERSAS